MLSVCRVLEQILSQSLKVYLLEINLQIQHFPATTCRYWHFVPEVWTGSTEKSFLHSVQSSSSFLSLQICAFRVWWTTRELWQALPWLRIMLRTAAYKRSGYPGMKQSGYVHPWGKSKDVSLLLGERSRHSSHWLFGVETLPLPQCLLVAWSDTWV